MQAITLRSHHCHPVLKLGEASERNGLDPVKKALVLHDCMGSAMSTT